MPSPATSSAAAAARHLASRSIHIKIHPPARNLVESREVVRVLQRFGNVEMFRNLKYDRTSPVPNAFLSILETEEAARAAVNASPIRYRLISESDTPSAHSPEHTTVHTTPASDLNTTSASASTSTSTSNPESESDSTLPQPPPPQPPSTKDHPIFELRISPSPFPHRTSIASSPLHGPFIPVTPRRSPIAADLHARIPPSIAKRGLLDWVTDSARVGGGGFRMVGEGDEGTGTGTGTGKAKIEWGRGAGVSAEDSKPWRVRDRERAERERAVPWVMRGLRSRSRSRAGERSGSS